MGLTTGWGQQHTLGGRGRVGGGKEERAGSGRNRLTEREREKAGERQTQGSREESEKRGKVIHGGNWQKDRLEEKTRQEINFVKENRNAEGKTDDTETWQRGRKRDTQEGHTCT